MIKDNKFYKFISETAPWFIGLVFGSVVSFIITAVPVIKDLEIPYIILITLAITVISMLISIFVFQKLIPKCDAKIKYIKYKREKMNQLLGLSSDKTKKELKDEFKESIKAKQKLEAEHVKQKLAYKENKKNRAGIDAFEG